MKMKHVLLLVLVGLILSACVPIEEGLIVDKPGKAFDITFKVADVNGVTKLVIKDKNRGCKNDIKGCLKVPKANSGDITFSFLPAMPLPCSTHPNNWFISKIELANIEGDFGQPVNNWIVQDFGANPTTGLAWERAVGQEVASVAIVDKNNFSGVLYYQITAESCDTHNSITSDPRVINEGGSN